MDRLIVERKLESLRHCLARIAQRRPASGQALTMDVDAQDVLVLNLARAVQPCVDLGAHLLAEQPVPPPNTMGETFDRLAEAAVIPPDLALRLKKAVGFRNIAVHAYDSLNWEIIFAIATKNIGDFERFARLVSTKLGSE